MPHRSSNARSLIQRPAQQHGASGLEMVRESKNRVLCVDDEPNALRALQRALRDRFDVVTASSGRAAIALMERQPFAVVLSDLRMPGMDGIQVLAHAREVVPEAVRVLISGQADVEAAAKAVNEGQLFRFLLKPCETSAVYNTVRDAADQHRLITAERVLLEETVTGSISALVDLLAITQPEFFGRATRLKRYAEGVASELGLRHHCALGVAAQLTQLGYIIVPEATAAKARKGVELTSSEQILLAKLLPFSEQLIASIPRLEPVRMILRLQYDSPARVGADDDCERSAAILRTVMAFDALESRGMSAEAAIDQMEQMEQFQHATLNALRRMCGLRHVPLPIRPLALVTASEPLRDDYTKPPALIEAVVHDTATDDEESGRAVTMPLSEVKPGMHFAEDVLGASGVLLVARGQEVTHSLAERISNSWSDFANTLQVRVMLKETGTSARSTGFQRVV